MSNLLVFLFFFEVLGLLLLLALLYAFVLAERRVGALAANGKLLNNTLGAKFLFMQTLLFFRGRAQNWLGLDIHSLYYLAPVRSQ